MPKTIGALALAWLICVSCPASAQQNQPEARAALDSFVSLQGSGKVAEALEKLSADVVVYDEGLDGQPVRLEGKEQVRAYLQNRGAQLPLSKSLLENVTVRSTSDSAWIVAAWTHTVGTGDEAADWNQLVTFYLRKDGGNWSIAGWHASAAAVPEEPFEGGPEDMPTPSIPRPPDPNAPAKPSR